MTETFEPTDEPAAAGEPAIAGTIDEGAAFETSGFRAPVFKPMFSQASQQYFTPRWLCEALPPIAEHAFGFDGMIPEERPSLNVIDPTCGSARLLAPFKERGHHVLGVELDARLADVAGKAVGKRAIRQGDIMAYGPVIPEGRWHVAAINPPYGIWMPVPPSSPYERYELSSGAHIESQHMVLELVTNLLAYNNGLLIAILSGKFFQNYPQAAGFLGRHFQAVVNVTLPKPFKPEYGIEVDAAFVVAITDSPYNSRKKPAPLTGPFEGDGPMLVRAVNAAFDEVKRNPAYRSWQTPGPGNPAVFHLHPPFGREKLPRVPDLEMAVDVDTSSLPLNLTARGISPRRDEPGHRTDWAAAWFKLYNVLPLQAYDAAQGTYAPLGEAYGSLPNLLMSGVSESRDRLTELGFDVALTAHDAAQIELRARRFARDRLPVRELDPLEYLAYFADGQIVAGANAMLPDGTQIPAGATYELRSRWFRRDEEVGAGEEKGTGKKRYVQHTYVDRGYLVLRFTPASAEHQGIELKPFTVEEVNPDQVQALVDAFGLPQVPTVDDLPALQGWAVRLARFMDEHERRSNGRRLYPTQAQDVARMACKSAVALLYEMGGGKTATIAHWATLRGYRNVVLVTPASVVPGIVEDLANWGFPARRLEHATISHLFEEKRRHKLAHGRMRTAFGRARRLREQIASLLKLRNGEMVEQAREWGMPAGWDAPNGTSPTTLASLDQVVKEKVQALEARLQIEEAILDAEDRRCRLEAEVARKRRHVRNLVAIRDKGKARDPHGIEVEIEQATREMDRLTHDLADAHADLGDVYHDPCKPLPDFFVVSYQDLSLGDHVGIFDPWSHDHFDRQGNFEGTVANLRGASCTCDAPRKGQVPDCPRCGTPWRGEGNGGGRVCHACGHVAWTMGRAPQRLLPAVNPRAPKREQIETRRQRIAILKEQNLNARAGSHDAEDVFLSTYHQWPMSNRAKALFSCVLMDEAQDAKSKLSLRGAAARGLRANGKALLTGTWMKGYITDLFWTAGWLLGFGSPLWPFPYRGGSARFLQQFGTFQFVTKEFADTLEVGRRKLIPSVSNLNRLWKLLSPVSIRRLKEDFLHDLPPKQRHIHWLEPTGKHDLLVGHVNGAMKDVFERELRKADPNMGAISAALWWGRYVASCPNEYGALHFAGAWGHMVNVDEISPAEARAILDQMQQQGAYLPAPRGLQVAYGFNKVDKAMQIVEEIKAANEKVIVFTSLRGLYRTLEAALKDRFIGYVGIDGVSTQKRNDVVRRFEASDATVLLAGTGTLNRGVTVNGANHVLILNLEWSPETTLQAEDRCHRPGQTREVHVHYLLSSDTVDEQMYDLVDQKWAAQRAVQDREAQHKTVEAILAEAALSNAQLAVAKAVLQTEFRRKGATAEEAKAKAEEAVERLVPQLVFGRAPTQTKARPRRSKPDVQVLYFRSLFDTEAEDLEVFQPADQPVQLAMFAF